MTPHVAQLAAAADALHNGEPSSQEAANAWLVAFCETNDAAAAAEALLSSPPGSASDAALVIAAGIVGRASSALGGQALEPLLGLYTRVSYRPAQARLAQALAEVVTLGGHEAALVHSAAFGSLAHAQQVGLLEALGTALEQSGSPEELASRSSAQAAIRRAVHILHAALAAADGEAAAEVCAEAVLECLAVWAGCGLGYVALFEERPELIGGLARLVAAGAVYADGVNALCGGDVPSSALLGVPSSAAVCSASRAASVLENSLRCGLELGEEMSDAAAAPLALAMHAWTGRVSTLGVRAALEQGVEGGEGAE